MQGGKLTFQVLGSRGRQNKRELTKADIEFSAVMPDGGTFDDMVFYRQEIIGSGK